MKPYTEKQLSEIVNNAKTIQEVSVVSNHVFGYKTIYNDVYIRIQSLCMDKVKALKF